jgi:hypothetical protein
MVVSISQNRPRKNSRIHHSEIFLTTIERQGGREQEQSKVGPKSEEVGMTKSNFTK